MASFWDQGPNQDFNLGGFQSAPPGAPNDPRLTTQPQPYQELAKDPMKPIPPELQGGTVGFTSSAGGPMSTMGQFFSRGGAVQQARGPSSTGSLFGSAMGGAMPMMPMNPSQQSQVPMQSPDGQHFQYVNAEHVPHYQGLGATIANGSSYGSQSGGF